MLNGNAVLGRSWILMVVLIFAFGSMRAQTDSTAPSGSSSQPAFGAPVSQPAAPIGASFGSSSGNATLRSDSDIAPAPGANYRVGADDVLAINVWHEPEVSRQVAVRPDGKISLPLIGDVQAVGLTPTELQHELQSRFAKYLNQPDVSVIVVQIRSQRFNVLGQVMRPGAYPFVPPISVIDAIATAGGLREFAKANKIYILRTLWNGQQQRVRIHYKDVLKGKRGSHDILLQNRDTLVVP